MFILKQWINCCSNTIEKQCEHRLTESLSLVRRYRNTHIELREKVCSVEHVIYIYIHTHTHLLPYTMEQSPSWGANWFAASQKFHAFYGPLNFNTAFRSVRHLYISWTTTTQSLPTHTNYWKSTLILSSHLRLVIPSDLFPPGFHNKDLYAPLPSPFAQHASPITFLTLLALAHYWLKSAEH